MRFRRAPGNRSLNNAPRNTYRCADGSWVAVSTSAQSIAERVMRLVGRPEYLAEPWFATGRGRAEHADELDAAVAAWVGERTRAEVLAAFEEAEAAVAPIYDVADVIADPAARRAGGDHHRAGPRPRAAAHAERAVPAVRAPRRDPLDRPVRTAPTPTRSSARSACTADAIAALRDRGVI